MKLIDRLDAAVTGRDGLPGKPKPDVFLEAAKRMKKNPEGSVVFEDAVLGVQAAKAAKMACVGIDRYKQPERLQEADIVVADLGEVDYEKLRQLVEKS